MRETERDTERERDRDTERQTDRQTDRNVYSERETHTDTDRQTETDGSLARCPLQMRAGRYPYIATCPSSHRSKLVPLEVAEMCIIYPRCS